MRDYHIDIFWSDEDGGYIADIPDLEDYLYPAEWFVAVRVPKAGDCSSTGRNVPP